MNIIGKKFKLVFDLLKYFRYKLFHMSRQLSLGQDENDFRKYWEKTKVKTHGGVAAVGKRKCARPLDSKKPIHLIFKSDKAKGPMSLRHPLHHRKVDKIIFSYADQFGVQIFDYSNNGNHLHLSLKFETRLSFQNYLRVVTGLIARLILKAQKGSAKGRFWTQLAFTRVSEWGRAFGELKKYIYRNYLEAERKIPYDRKTLKWIKLE